MGHFIFKYSLQLVTTVIFLAGISAPLTAMAEETKPTSIQHQLAELEASSGGRLGISATNTANNHRIQYRATERFPFQSTFKVIGVAAILQRSMTDHQLLQQRVMYKKEDLVFWSPITEKHLADGMTIFDLCAAAVMYSDSTAINLLIKELGGPEAVNVFTRSIGDNTFRLDGWESELNSKPDDLQDTSTPAAMEQSLQQLASGTALAPSQREQLITWMKNNTTGNARIRAGVPKEWTVADKTGGGRDYGVTNDIGIIWPPQCPPIVIAVYFVQNNKNAPRRDDVVASATRMVVHEFSQTDQCI